MKQFFETYRHHRRVGYCREAALNIAAEEMIAAAAEAIKQAMLDRLHRIADAPPRTVTIMVAGSGGAGAGVAIVNRPAGMGQRLARWMLGR